MNKGQSLFEVIFALGIASLILVAAIALTTSSLRSSTFSKNSLVATQLAQQASEWLRSERDSDWVSFSARASATGTTWCLVDTSWPVVTGACSGTMSGTIFSRSATLTSRDTNNDTIIDSIDADVSVSWEDGQGTHTSKNQTTLTDWRRR